MSDEDAGRETAFEFCFEVAVDVFARQSGERNPIEEWQQVKSHDVMLATIRAWLDLFSVNVLKPVRQPGTSRPRLVWKWQPTRNLQSCTIALSGCLGRSPAVKVLRVPSGKVRRVIH